MASATYLEAYNIYRYRFPPDVADRYATARTLQLGNLSELYGPNPIPKHLMDYWNNYEGVALAKEIASKFGASISNDRLAQIVAGEINASIQAPFGKGRFILFNGVDQHGVNFKDPRLEIDRYDLKRLPNEGWGIAPFPKAEGYVPPAIIGAFPMIYAGSSPKQKNVQDIAGPKTEPNLPSDSISPGREAPEQQGQPQNPTKSGAAEPRSTNPQLSVGQQLGGPQQVTPMSASGLPPHVIDAGNYLRANGIEITPRTMYVANILGPQRAVELINRTGSTSSNAVPSPDAATGEQMRAWARQLRLGPAAPADSAAAPAAQAAWSNAAAAPPGDVSEDAGLPGPAPAEL